MTVASPPHALAATEPLGFRRLPLDAGRQLANALGGRTVGGDAFAIDAPLLWPEGGVYDTWIGSGDVHEQRHGCVSFATDGHWLYGCAEIDDAAIGLRVAAQRAYTELFEVLAKHDCPHLLRLWNYLADINRETDGVERYRQFNAGRQQAFIDARRSAFEGTPAACALGTRGGPLRVSFLAGRAAPLAIENPRQVSAYHYPDTYGRRSPTFSRAALADAGGGRTALFISGTSSIVGHATMHAGDVRAQTEESLANIAAVRALADVCARTTFVPGELSWTVYLRRAADLPVVREVFERAVGPESPAAREAIYLQADVCRADLLVEIEAHGFAPNGGAA